MIFSPSGCPELALFCKARGQVADCLAASSLKAVTVRTPYQAVTACAAARADNSSNLEFVKSEAQKYLETGFAVTFISGKDILDFWRMHEKQYPHLAKMARQFLGCPASSASVHGT